MATTWNLVDPREYVASWLADKGAIQAETGDLQLPDGSNDIDFYPSMWLDYRKDIRDFNAAQRAAATEDAPARTISGATQDEIKYALQEHKQAFIREAKQSTLAELAYDEQLVDEGHQQLASWLSAVMAREAAPHEIAVFQHWLHCVKRKLAGKHTEWQMFLVVFSITHGPGKSRAVERLLEPLTNRLVVQLDGGAITDDRRYTQFARYSVGYFDEMSGIQKTAIEQLKQIITGSMVSMRPMRTNEIKQVPQRCMFIGTSNKPVNLMINDVGMRRFYEFQAASKINHEQINNVDMLAVWKAINEHQRDASYYLRPHLEEIQRFQNEELVTEDPVLTFLDSLQIKPGDIKKEHKLVRATKLYERYASWTDENGYVKMSSGTLGKRIKQLGIKSHRDAAGVSYVVAPESQIGLDKITYEAQVKATAGGNIHVLR